MRPNPSSTLRTSPSKKFLADSLLDWPFLLVLVIIYVLIRFYGPLGEAIKHRGFSFEIGGNKVSVGRAIEAMDEEMKDSLSGFQDTMERVRDQQTQIDELKDAIVKLKEGTPVAEKIAIESAAAAQTPGQKDEAAWRLVRNALLHGKYVWRSLERLSMLAGVSMDEMQRILADHHDEAIRGIGKSGRAIARHVSHTP